MKTLYTIASFLLVSTLIFLFVTPKKPRVVPVRDRNRCPPKHGTFYNIAFEKCDTMFISGDTVFSWSNLKPVMTPSENWVDSLHFPPRTDSAYAWIYSGADSSYINTDTLVVVQFQTEKVSLFYGKAFIEWAKESLYHIIDTNKICIKRLSFGGGAIVDTPIVCPGYNELKAIQSTKNK